MFSKNALALPLVALAFAGITPANAQDVYYTTTYPGVIERTITYPAVSSYDSYYVNTTPTYYGSSVYNGYPSTYSSDVYSSGTARTLRSTIGGAALGAGVGATVGIFDRHHFGRDLGIGAGIGAGAGLLNGLFNTGSRYATPGNFWY